MIEDKVVSSLYFLKTFSKYNHNNNEGKIPFTYQDKLSNNLTFLREKLNLEAIEGSGSELQKLMRLLKWSSAYLKYEGKIINDRRYDQCDWFEVIAKSKQEGYKLNCRYIALLFTQVLLAAGFKARWVSCLPVELISKERHCVTEVYVKSLYKWVVFDAAYNLVYFDKKGTLLNLFDMRNLIIREEKFRFFTKSTGDYDYIWSCWVNHIFRFQYLLNNHYNMLSTEKQVFLYLNPGNYLTEEENSDEDLYQAKNIFYFDDDRLFT